MIVYYEIPDLCGNSLTLLIQAENRERADEIALRQVEVKRKRGHTTYGWLWNDKKVTDLTSRDVITADIHDHELDGGI